MRLGPGYPTYSCSTCLLDMTPTDGGFGNAALEVGQTYFDAESEMRVTPLSADASSLVVQVEIGAAPPFAVDRHANPSNSFPNSVLENGEVGTIEPSWLNGGGAPAADDRERRARSPDRARAPHTRSRTRPRTTARCRRGSASPASTRRAIASPSWRTPRLARRCTGTPPSKRPSATRPFARGRSTSAGASRTCPSSRGDYRYVETVLHQGLTSGCGGTLYCPENQISRAQMAVLLLRAEHGAAYVPPAGDRHGLRRRARERIRRRVDRAPRGRGDHGGLRKRCELLPELAGHAGADGGVHSQDRARIGLDASGGERRLHRRPDRQSVRALGRGAEGRGRDGRLRRQRLLPDLADEARPDGGVPDEGVRLSLYGRSR